MKKYLFCAAILVILAAGCSKKTITVNPPQVEQDPSNSSYIIDGKTIALKNGLSEVSGEDGVASSKVITKIFEATAQGDLNGDGLPDTAVILTQDTGGSGTFYYAAVAIKTSQGFLGSNTVLLGDRIAPQNNQIQNGLLIVNYSDRKPSEDFSVKPSVGKSLYLEYFKNALIARPEAVQINEPYPYGKVSSPLTITGQARGSWFFEASFPVVLADSNGKIIAQGVAKAQGDWMTEQFVPFIAVLNFNKPQSTQGVLTLKKDNPSGLPQNNSLFEMPIVFKQ